MQRYEIVNNDVTTKNGDYYFIFLQEFSLFGKVLYSKISNLRVTYKGHVGWKVIDIDTGDKRYFGICQRELAMEAQLNKLGYYT